MKLFDSLTISAHGFGQRARIPDEFSADGGNEAPSFSVDGVPEGTVELALIVHDPDAPLPQGFTHWALYGIPADTETITLDSGRTGPNTLGSSEYSGPQPPPGHGVHHYYFWIFALSSPVQGEPSREEFLEGYSERILEQARVVGLYSAD